MHAPRLADQWLADQGFLVVRVDGRGTTGRGRAFSRGLQGGALFRTSIYHSHTVEEVLDRIEEYFEAIESGRPYYGEAGAPLEEAPELDTCEAASVV